MCGCSIDLAQLTASLICVETTRKATEMTSKLIRPAITVCGFACLWCGQVSGQEPGQTPPAKTSLPTAKATPSPTAVPNPTRPPIMIRGRIGTTIRTDRDRAGITHYGSSREFTKSPMVRQMDGSLPHTRKFGDGTVIAGPVRQGITHAGKTFPFGAEIGTRRTGWPNTGLTTLHSPGRVWESFRKAP